MVSEDLVYNYLVLVLVALVLSTMLLFNEYFIRYCLGGTWMNSRQIWISIGTTFILLSLMVSRFYYLKNYKDRMLEKDKAQYMMLSRTSFYVLLILSLLFVLSLVLYAGKFSWAIKSNNVETGRVSNWFRGVKQIPSQCRVIRESRERERMRKETRLRSSTRYTRSSLPLSIRGSTPEQRPTERTERTERRPTRMTSIGEIDVHVDDTLTFDNE